MYPLVHLTSQNNPNEGRQFMSTPALDFYHLVNGDMPYTQRKEFLLQAHSAINLANNGKQQMVPSNGANNGKTFYNTSNKRENWASNRGHGKPKRFVIFFYCKLRFKCLNIYITSLDTSHLKHLINRKSLTT